MIFVAVLATSTLGATPASADVITTAAGTGAVVCNPFLDPFLAPCEDGILASEAVIAAPWGLSATAEGGYLIASGSGRIREVSGDGTITRVAGSGPNGFGGDGGLATSARIDNAFGVSATANNGFLIADQGNDRIRCVTSNGRISTIAGIDTEGFSGDGGPATQAELRDPQDVAMTPDGGYLIADTFNGRVRRVSPSGTITTAASGLSAPTVVAPTPDGGFLVSESFAGRVRKVDPFGGSTIVASGLVFPTGLAPTEVDGAFLVTDSARHQVFYVEGGVQVLVAGNGQLGYGGDGGPATEAILNTPNGIAFQSGGGILIADTQNHRIRAVDFSIGAAAIPFAAAPCENQSPTAQFTLTPTTAGLGQDVTFDASASDDPDGTIVSYQWDLDGDGSLDVETADDTITHSYQTAGVRTIKLLVTDDDGGTAETTKNLTVTDQVVQSPTASFTVDPPGTAFTGQTVAFNGAASSDPNGTIVSYAWDLDGDGSNGFEVNSGATPTTSRSYSAPDTITVRLRVTDNDGLSATASQQLTLLVGGGINVSTDPLPPVADFDAEPNPALVGENVTFDGSESSDADGEIVSFEWDLDGDPGTGTDGFELAGTGEQPTTARTYGSAGTLTVRLRVTDDDGQSHATIRTLTVRQRPEPSLTASPNPALVGGVVTFDGSASSDADGTVELYEWDLDGNGTFETTSGADPTTSRSYSSHGELSVGLRVTDDDGLSKWTSKALVVQRRPAASFKLWPNPAQTGDVVTFDASDSSDADGEIVSFQWDLDGDPGTGTDGFELAGTGEQPTAARTYGSAGTVTPRLRVTDDDGHSRTTTRTLTIDDQAPGIVGPDQGGGESPSTSGLGGSGSGSGGSGSGSGGSGSGGSDGGGKATAVTIVVSRKVSLNRAGAASVRISCKAPPDNPCKGKLTLRLRAAASGLSRRMRLGASKFTIPAGKTRAVRVRLKRRARRALRRSRRLRAEVIVTSGGSRLSKRVTLKAPREKKKANRKR